MSAISNRSTAFIVFPVICLILSCTRNQVDFGTVPENSYTNLIYIDTVAVKMSTVITDSFATGGATAFLLGKYKDPYLGLVSAKPFFQMNNPSSVPDLTDIAVYDSLTLIIKPNKNYYGDTTVAQTFYVNELSQSIVLGYNSRLYNTTNVETNTVPLGSKTMRLRPTAGDSIVIRLDDAKGMELFAKLKAKADDVTNSSSFLNYFKGLSLSTDDNDTSVVYGLKDTVIMRVNYHTTTPYPVAQNIDFLSQINSLAFNQVITDRTGTGIVAANKGLSEISSTETHNLSFTQPATGLYLKLIFPSLRGVILNEDLVRLVKAELILRPLPQSFDRSKYILPSQVYLVKTDGSNIATGSVSNATGTAVEYSDPVIDDIYGENNYYSFDVTSYIGSLLNTSGSEDEGLFVTQSQAGTTLQLNKIVAGDATIAGYSTQLKLTALVIKK